MALVSSREKNQKDGKVANWVVYISKNQKKKLCQTHQGNFSDPPEAA